MNQGPNGNASIFLFFPAYNDEKTIEAVVMKSRKVLSDLAREYHILIVDDGSRDNSGEIADIIAAACPDVSVIHHSENLVYGKALQTGFARAKDYEWVCFTDGDDQYDVQELYRMKDMLANNDMIITFRYAKVYSTFRVFMSAVYNMLLRFIFRSKYRDISSGLKMARTRILGDIPIISSSPFAGAEVVLRAMLKKYRIAEVGITMYPRKFGVSQSTSILNILGTLRDMFKVRRESSFQSGRRQGPTPG